MYLLGEKSFNPLGRASPPGLIPTGLEGLGGGVQLLSHVRLFATPWTAARQANLPGSLLKLMSIESVMLSTMSSSAACFSFCLQTFPASGSFPMSQLFA